MRCYNDNEVSSSSDSESEKCKNLALMASYHSDHEYEEISCDFLLYDNDAQSAIDELLNKYKIRYK